MVTQYAGKHGGSFGLASKFVARLLAKKGGLIGFIDVSNWNKALYNILLPVDMTKAVAEHEREALRAAGLSVPLSFPRIASVSDAGTLAKFNVEAGKFLIVHFFAGAVGRSMSPQKSHELIVKLAASFPGISLRVTGASADRDTALSISEGTGAKVIAGEATLQEMIHLIVESRGVVSVDTGIAHLTAQLGKPLVVMRTCLGPNWWFKEQYGNSAPIVVMADDIACGGIHTKTEFPKCLNGVPTEEVVVAFTKILTR